MYSSLLRGPERHSEQFAVAPNESALILQHQERSGRRIEIVSLNPNIPARFEKIISKALPKDREARYQTAAEIHADPKLLKETVGDSPRWRLRAAGVLALLGLLTAIFRVYKLRTRSPEARAAPKLTQLTVNSFENSVLSGAISLDGRYLAYIDLNGIYIKVLESGETRTVPLPGIGMALFEEITYDPQTGAPINSNLAD